MNSIEPEDAAGDARRPSDSGSSPSDVVSPSDVTSRTDSGVSPTDTGVGPTPDASAGPRIDITTPAPGDPATRSQSDVCAVWNTAVMRAQSAGPFTQGSAMCAPGTLPQATVDAAVLMTNVYRYLAGLPNVTENADQTRAAQACAELMEANRMLSHMPPTSWTCYTALGAMGAARSNITSGGSSPVASLAGWVDDSRDISNTLGHRRWILFPQLGPIGYGQARQYACQYVLGARGSGRKNFVAWPNEGVTPMESMTRIWSFSSASLGVGASTMATVEQNGMPLNVMAMPRANGYGDPTISWNMPAIVPGATYRVTITGLSGGMNVTYEVRPVRCGG
ncbi:MAG: CAP domain-containing protein [Myxococcales bacterium]|nr:CAP domain-containing protein [Myxococcales bacterium]